MIRGWAEIVQWKFNLQLQDIPFTGPRFTWSNNRENEGLIMERLDRGYATEEWLNEFPKTFIRNLPITHSDHGPIFLQTQIDSKTTRRPYQIENWCLNYEEVKLLIYDIWVLHIVGSPAYTLTRRLHIIRGRLKSWCLDKKIFWGLNWKNIFDRLQYYGCQVQNREQGTDFLQHRRPILEEISIACSYWRQRMKDVYIQAGDLPTKPLFRRLRQKKQANFIHMLQDDNGLWVSQPNDLELLIQRHFNTLLTSNGGDGVSLPAQSEAIDLVLRELHLPAISSVDSAKLMQPLTTDEVKSAMFSLADGKSPGLDGYNAEFFKTYWETVGGCITATTHRFFTTGHFLKDWNQTLMILVPKLNPSIEVNHLRPISLCNVLYKCLAKWLVNRMKSLLPMLIDDYQITFIPGRLMDDNILIAHEITHLINRQRRGGNHLAALKLDISKAYDRVSWVFLLKVLHAYGFPAHWIKMIQTCISTVTYRVLINGHATNSFIPTSGLRQGDPLSPYLFLFCMDILSRMTSLATDIRQFNGIKISHLFFADDSMFFFEASQDSCRVVQTVITRFCAISGQVLNLQKSFVNFSPNTPMESQQDYKVILPMESQASLGTYLGVPIDLQTTKVQHFTPLLDKICHRITSWSHTNISQPTKMIIINSILIGAIMNHLAIFRIPTTITNKIDSMLASFFWKDSHGRGIHWKKRNILHSARHSGGLGLRNVGFFNRALLMKKAWRIHQNPHLLLAKVYRKKRLDGRSPLRHSQQSSWGRKGILLAENFLHKHMKWKVGNGKHIRVSMHGWLHGSTPVFRDGISLMEPRNPKVGDLFLPNQQGWDTLKVHRLFDPATARQICGIELPHDSQQRDVQFWPYNI